MALPAGDADFPGRWRAIKTPFWKAVGRLPAAITGHDEPWLTLHLAAAVWEHTIAMIETSLAQWTSRTSTR
jgi:hypothetical protein